VEDLQAYSISVDGCDASTSVEMKLSKSEYDVVKKVADLITKSSDYGCMPTMEIQAVKED
jgi:hypothetical protein